MTTQADEITADTIEWGDPPPKKSSRTGRAKRFVEVLKQRPGVWAEYPAKRGNVGHSAGGQGVLKRYGLEITARAIAGTSRHRVWARWPEDGES